MNKIILSLICAVVIASGSKIAIAETPAPAPRLLRDYTVTELISHYSVKYGVSEEKMTKTIQCESGFNEKAVGDGGHSFGLSQINLPSNPTVTVAQATNKVFAVAFMAQGFRDGNQNRWTCYRDIYGVQSKHRLG